MKKSDLELIIPKYNNEVEIIITGDYNDSNYDTTKNLISLDRYEKVLPIIKKIMDNNSVNNWKYREEYLTEEEIMLAERHLSWPSGDDIDCHTIEEFEIYFQCKETGIRYIVGI